ncbi:B3/B4 domain-containing protein [Fictibacillus fluitans]|uniref:Phenylalanine--tRNA ligase beta subunit-related protein n=1 Tax=Fictibacillus fluitans TaxID=3058422 RepID=A0ABT8I3N9_9BACL|nr:phenylalanine--tRNA ligase beta subunit-related protein [Fictibacillus sp. NE201]MDN4527650.1 phenylalanine--tRNA ligase beta subunit-related protein [Fictibacillus sp. NE201]
MIKLAKDIKKLVPSFKIGVILYHDIVIEESPQMLRGRFQLFLESLKLDAIEKTVADHPGIKEWRQIFKTLSMDPSRYRPSSEALLRRVYGGKDIALVNSAVDVNNFFSLQYGIPLGIYNSDAIHGDVEVALGAPGDQYEGLNGRLMNMDGKLLSKDEEGAFGSPIVDSKRTMTEEHVKNALQLVYLRPSMPEDEAEKLLSAIEKMFVQIHGGSSESFLIH